MNALRSQELVVGCLAASAVIAAGSTLAEGDTPGIRLLVGGTVTAIGLATVSMFNPELAGAFAVLILTATTFNYGGPFMDAVSKFTKEAKPSKPTKPSARHGQANKEGSVNV